MSGTDPDWSTARGAYAELLGGALLAVFGLTTATGLEAFARPGVPRTIAPFLLVPFGCLAVGTVQRARSTGCRAAGRIAAWGLAIGFTTAFGSLALLGLSVVGIPVDGPVLPGFVAGCALVPLASVSLGVGGRGPGGISAREGALFAGWPVVAALCLGLFVLLGVGTVVLATTVPLGVAVGLGGYVRSTPASDGWRRR